MSDKVRSGHVGKFENFGLMGPKSLVLDHFSLLIMDFSAILDKQTQLTMTFFKILAVPL